MNPHCGGYSYLQMSPCNRAFVQLALLGHVCGHPVASDKIPVKIRALIEADGKISTTTVLESDGATDELPETKNNDVMFRQDTRAVASAAMVHDASPATLQVSPQDAMMRRQGDLSVQRNTSLFSATRIPQTEWVEEAQNKSVDDDAARGFFFVGKIENNDLHDKKNVSHSLDEAKEVENDEGNGEDDGLGDGDKVYDAKEVENDEDDGQGDEGDEDDGEGDGEGHDEEESERTHSSSVTGAYGSAKHVEAKGVILPEDPEAGQKDQVLSIPNIVHFIYGLGDTEEFIFPWLMRRWHEDATHIPAMAETADESQEAVDIWLPGEPGLVDGGTGAQGSFVGARSPPIAVKPLSTHSEGLGSILQHYRKSLSYALALGLPWLGILRNVHDGIDYTEYLGLCQPLCANRSDLRSFDHVNVSASAIDLTSGTFTMLKGIQKPTLLVISEMNADHSDLDQGHTKYLTRLRDRFLANSMPISRCPEKPYLTFHFRWGDVKTNDYEHPDGRAIAMSTAIALIKIVKRTCPFDVKLMSEGQDVKDAFAKKFDGAFEYIDGLQSKSLSNSLQTFACSTVLIGGSSSFSVLGALLSHGVVLAPKTNVKYQSLDFVMDFADILSTTHVSAPDLGHALRNVAPGEQFYSKGQ